MPGELELPDEIWGFGSWLLWMIATRAPELVDRVYDTGRVRSTRKYGRVGAHRVPTPSLVAWLLLAAEAGLPPDELPEGGLVLEKRQQVLRTLVSRALGGEPHRFRDGWLRDLAAMCGFSDGELSFLLANREDFTREGMDHEEWTAALRQAIERTFETRQVPPHSEPEPDQSSVAPNQPQPERSRQDVDVTPPPRTLPRDTPSFTGREAQLRRLEIEATDTDSGDVVSVYSIGGLAGVGKSAFAVHAAHRLAPRFPDGQIFMPLHGHTPGKQPVDPADALATLLQICGFTAAGIPSDLEARSARWRDHLAERRILLLLDDAAGPEQVRPLLPGYGGNLVLITSRQHLIGLEDKKSLSLDILDSMEAASLLVKLADRSDLTPSDRAVGEIAELCGRLPLAIGMLARQLHHHPAWTAAQLASELAAAQNRLDLIEAGDLTVAAAFDLSYADLTETQQRLFRRLGLHPGTDIDAYAAAALDGTDVIAARRNLIALYEQYLLAEIAPGRYDLHDLIRQHARAKVATDPPADSEAAVSRLLDYYQHGATVAEAVLSRQSRKKPGSAALSSPPPMLPDLSESTRALEWIRTERTNLLASLDHVTATGQHARSVAFTGAIAALLRLDGPWADAICRHAAAAHAASRISDRQGEANALSDLGDIRYLTGDYPDARDAQQRALDIYRDLGDRLGWANALSDLGVVQEHIGNYEEAARALQEALDIYRAMGDLRGQANALSNIGVVREHTGEFRAAATALDEAQVIYRDLDLRQGLANVLIYLGAVWRMIGQYRDAVGALEEALTICHDLGQRLGQANALTFLGAVRERTHDYPAAAEALNQALGMHRELGDRGGEAQGLNIMGALHRARGSLDEARACHQQALTLAGNIHSSWDEAHAWAGLGRCSAASGNLPDARVCLLRAQAIFERLGTTEASEIEAQLDELRS